MRKVIVGLAVVAGLGLVAQAAVAQTAGARPAAAQGFGAGYMDIGPTVGFGSIAGANLAFGARFEKFVRPLPTLGNGMLGIQVGATFYSYSNPYFKYKYIPIGATANYHFRLADPKIDPFLGLGLGFQIVTCSASAGYTCGGSALYFIGRAGVRYFFSPKMALYADAGAGGAALNVGVMFKLK